MIVVRGTADRDAILQFEGGAPAAQGATLGADLHRLAVLDRPQDDLGVGRDERLVLQQELPGGELEGHLAVGEGAVDRKPFSLDGQDASTPVAGELESMRASLQVRPERRRVAHVVLRDQALDAAAALHGQAPSIQAQGPTLLAQHAAHGFPRAVGGVRRTLGAQHDVAGGLRSGATVLVGNGLLADRRRLDGEDVRADHRLARRVSQPRVHVALGAQAQPAGPGIEALARHPRPIRGERQELAPPEGLALLFGQLEHVRRPELRRHAAVGDERRAVEVDRLRLDPAGFVLEARAFLRAPLEQRVVAIEEAQALPATRPPRPGEGHVALGHELRRLQVQVAQPVGPRLERSARARGTLGIDQGQDDVRGLDDAPVRPDAFGDEPVRRREREGRWRAALLARTDRAGEPRAAARLGAQVGCAGSAFCGRAAAQQRDVELRALQRGALALQDDAAAGAEAARSVRIAKVVGEGAEPTARTQVHARTGDRGRAFDVDLDATALVAHVHALLAGDAQPRLVRQVRLTDDVRVRGDHELGCRQPFEARLRERAVGIELALHAGGLHRDPLGLPAHVPDHVERAHDEALAGVGFVGPHQHFVSRQVRRSSAFQQDAGTTARFQVERRAQGGATAHRGGVPIGPQGAVALQARALAFGPVDGDPSAGAEGKGRAQELHQHVAALRVEPGPGQDRFAGGQQVAILDRKGRVRGLDVQRRDRCAALDEGLDRAQGQLLELEVGRARAFGDVREALLRVDQHLARTVFRVEQLRADAVELPRVRIRKTRVRGGHLEPHGRRIRIPFGVAAHLEARSRTDLAGRRRGGGVGVASSRGGGRRRLDAAGSDVRLGPFLLVPQALFALLGCWGRQKRRVVPSSRFFSCFRRRRLRGCDGVLPHAVFTLCASLEPENERERSPEEQQEEQRALHRVPLPSGRCVPR